MSLVYLADGREIRAEVESSHGIGTIQFEGRTISVEKLPAPYEYRGWGEVVHIRLKGHLWGFVLKLQEYTNHMAMVDIVKAEEEATRRRNPGDVVMSSKSVSLMVRYDQSLHQWREMTEEEVGELSQSRPRYQT